GGASAGGVAAHRNEAARAVDLQPRGAGAEPTLHLAREGRDARGGGARAPAAGRGRSAGALEGRHARGRGAARVRSMGSRPVRGVRAHARRPAADVVRKVVGPRSVAVHVSVLVDEVVFLLRPRDEGWVIDGTVGMGGHAEAILSASGDSVRLLGLDADPAALPQARERLAPFGDRVALAPASFGRLEGAPAAPGTRRPRPDPPALAVSSR